MWIYRKKERDLLDRVDDLDLAAKSVESSDEEICTQQTTTIPKPISHLATPVPLPPSRLELDRLSDSRRDSLPQIDPSSEVDPSTLAKRLSELSMDNCDDRSETNNLPFDGYVYDERRGWDKRMTYNELERRGLPREKSGMQQRTNISQEERRAIEEQEYYRRQLWQNEHSPSHGGSSMHEGISDVSSSHKGGEHNGKPSAKQSAGDEGKKKPLKKRIFFFSFLAFALVGVSIAAALITWKPPSKLNVVNNGAHSEVLSASSSPSPVSHCEMTPDGGTYCPGPERTREETISDVHNAIPRIQDNETLKTKVVATNHYRYDSLVWPHLNEQPPTKVNPRTVFDTNVRAPEPTEHDIEKRLSPSIRHWMDMREEMAIVQRKMRQHFHAATMR